MLAALGVLAVAATVSGMNKVAEEQRALRDAQIADELIAMREADQAIRALMFGAVPDTEPLSAERVRALDAERVRLDHENVARLSAILDELGEWPSISRFDGLSSQSACAIAVHGVKDPAFMERAQILMEPLVRIGDADPECWAQVTDRLLVARGAPQLYGTQMRSEERDGQIYWGSAPIQQPDDLIARRAAVGLTDYEEYLARMRRDYHVPDAALPFPDEPPSSAPAL